MKTKRVADVSEVGLPGENGPDNDVSDVSEGNLTLPLT